MTPTPEQLAIIEAARNTSENLEVQALAGAAKTSTLILVAQALPGVPILCLAFNKKIALEMKQRLPGNCTAKTLHSLGMNAWNDYLGRRCTVNGSKMHQLFKALVDASADRNALWDERSDIMDALSYGKARGWVPDGTPGANALISDDQFLDTLDVELTPLAWSAVRTLASRSIALARAGEIDFDDMVLLPVVFPCYVEGSPLVLVDEAQDLSSLNHALLRKVVRKRIIAVGDPCQAIYGFRGAHQESMDVLREAFSMRTFTLSVSFRCPRSIVREARWRAPHMQWPEWAEEGEVSHAEEWSFEMLPHTAAVVCRNNAPLFSLAMRLIRAGRMPTMPRNDIGPRLANIMRRFGPVTLPQEAVLAKIEEWQATRAKKTRDTNSLADQAECLRIFASHGKDLGQALTWIKDLTERSGTLELCTIHKSKGLEWDEVFILDEHLIGRHDQEPNLRYVAQTRARKHLHYITTKGLQETHD